MKRIALALLIAPFFFVVTARAQVPAPPVDPIPGDDPPPEPAEPRADDPEARRAALFTEARNLAVAGRWAEAATLFREVVAIRSAPRALIALAIAEQELGHLLAAKALLVRAVRDAEMGALQADRLAAERALASLGPTIPRVRLIRDLSDPRQLSAVVDGQKVPIVDSQIEIDPGRHQVSIRAFEHVPQRVEVELSRGETHEVRVSLRRRDPEEERRGAAAGVRGGYAGPITMGVAGGAVLGVGLTLIGLGVASQDEARELCGGGVTGCPEAARYPALRGRDEILAGDVLTAAGGAAVAASIAWVIGIAATEASPAAIPTADGVMIRF